MRALAALRSGRALILAGAVGAALAALVPARAQDGTRAAPAAAEATPPDPGELGPEARACLDGALRWLAAHQGEGGVVRGDRSEKQDVASTALAGLAWLASGSSQNRGPYARNIENALQFLLRAGRPGPGGYGMRFHDEGRTEGRMHAHGFATLFLAELYGMAKGGAREDRAATLRGVLKRSVQLTIRSQTERKGGWGYYFAGEHEAYEHDEASTTITQIQALRAARNAGIEVPAVAIDKAIGYVKKSMTATGAKYSLGGGAASERTSFELTAAAVATLNASGVYKSPELERGLGVLRRAMDRQKQSRLNAADSYYFYGNLYAAQAMFQVGGDDWTAWFRDAQTDLVGKAKRRGELAWWLDERSFGDAYATASACLILQIPLRYLPIFER